MVVNQGGIRCRTNVEQMSRCDYEADAGRAVLVVLARKLSHEIQLVGPIVRFERFTCAARVHRREIRSREIGSLYPVGVGRQW